jgi:hypothetical protein
MGVVVRQGGQSVAAPPADYYIRSQSGFNGSPAMGDSLPADAARLWQIWSAGIHSRFLLRSTIAWVNDIASVRRG